MQRTSKFTGFVFIAIFFLLSLLGTGCAVRVRSYYDPGHGDYHRWDNHERVYYRQWAVETHRDEHRDFRRLNREEQNEYWNWRHHHPDARP
ncbi:MAG: hypothetical protein ACRD2U_08865 [Terriglobales bacterium]